MSSTRHTRSVAQGTIVTALFLALLAAAWLGFLWIFDPRPPAPRVAAETGYDTAAADAAMDPAQVRAELDAFLALGSRYPGQPGFEAARTHIRAAFETAGLEVLEYPYAFAAPVTLERRIVDAAGAALAGVEVYPFLPNWLQPIVTPAEGIAGRLELVTDERLLEAESFTDAIALIDAAAPPKQLGFTWMRYAQLGFRGVIVAHREGLAAMPWIDITPPQHMTLSAPVVYPRLAATEGIFAHVGQTVRLHVRAQWQNVDGVSVVGILRAPEGDASEALLLTSGYDACSVLPDLAPGPLEAHGVAFQLSALRALAASRDALRRDVVFVSTPSWVPARLPVDRLAALLGTADDLPASRRRLDGEAAENAAQAARVQAALQCLATPGFFTDPEIAERTLRAATSDARATVAERVQHVLNTLLFEGIDGPMRARLAFLAEGAATDTPAFRAYQKARRDYDNLAVAAGYPVVKLVRDRRELVAELDLGRLCREHLTTLQAFHVTRAAKLAQGLALHEALVGYQRLIPVTAALAPVGPTHGPRETFTFRMGASTEAQRYLYSQSVNDLVLATAQRLGPSERLRVISLRNDGHQRWAAQVSDQFPVDSDMWNAKGHPAFAFVNTDRLDSYRRVGSPVEEPYHRDTESVRESLRLAGRIVLALAAGEGWFEEPRRTPIGAVGGRVLASNVGRSLVPNYAVAGALMGHKPSGWRGLEGRGYFNQPAYFTDPYGRYDLPQCSVEVATPGGADGYSPQAVVFDEAGRIAWIKDEGASGQAIYKSMHLGWDADRSRVNVALFRASPITLFDLINPQSFAAFSGVGFVTSEGLAPVTRHNIFFGVGGQTTAFLEPDRRVFVTFKAGAAENPLLQTTRAFALNGPPDYTPRTDREIDGPGFLPLHEPIILDIPRRIARSMLQVNGLRLDLQQRAGMSDERTETFHVQARKLLEQAEAAPDLPHHERYLLAQEAATYAILNHPVLRRAAFEAIVGILWYLGLLVPFVFFFEKLVCGYADIRKQLAAQAIIFLVVFALLRWLHPAFAMVRSSLMILLGFVVLLVSGGVTLLFSGKFQENLEAIRRRRGQVTEAEVDTMGVMGTAFALGLNNMHRRIVRTGLTCATLVLITFAMICFTSVQSDVVNRSVATGRAAYQGFVVKNEKLRPMSYNELFALQTRYAHLYTVSPRTMLVGRREWDQTCHNPDLDLTYEGAGGGPRKTALHSLLLFGPEEPLRDRVTLLTQRGWLPEPPKRAARGDTPLPILVPDVLAQELSIRPEAVDAGEVLVEINGRRCRVHGIFEAESLRRLRDLDDRSLLPFDATALRSVESLGTSTLLAGDDEARLDAGRMVLALDGGGIEAAHSEWRLASVAIHMPDLPYRGARAEVERYLEQSGRDMWYGLGSMAYRGKRARERSFAGLMEILIPLVIASITVLNTMRGSVYERRDEIFVYNAVGIAPRYIFAMFFSEAFVYAVVGCELGYLLSQATGRLLAALGWTGGLSMTFSSIQTVYVSLAIMGAVFLSTLFPARAAMRIAAPSDDPGWRLPEPDGDRMAFALPFVFDPRDRVAVLAFFNRFLVDHGEGSSGAFFAGQPRADLSREPDPVDPEAPVPCLRCMIWLKPFDLGVAQEMEIAMPTDPATREFVARVTFTRVSGTREAWLRLSRSFVGQVRQNFLYWRAVSQVERGHLFEEARELLLRDIDAPSRTPAPREEATA